MAAHHIMDARVRTHHQRILWLLAAAAWSPAAALRLEPARPMRYTLRICPADYFPKLQGYQIICTAEEEADGPRLRDLDDILNYKPPPS